MTERTNLPPPVDAAAWRARQKSRNRALGLVLGALVVLFFALTVVKIGLRAQGGG